MKRIVLLILMLGMSVFAQDDDHSGHDHGSMENEQAKEESIDEHAGHDHDNGEPANDEHDAHDSEALELEIAEGGLVARMASFPAEIQVNRDRAAAVSPKYAGTVREVVVEIGDTVKKGDLLATLESRETLATYPVKAPLDGTVVARGKSIGELAGEDTVLFEIVDLSSVWVEVHVFPQYGHTIKKGQSVHLMAADGHEAQTTIAYVSPLVDTKTRTLKARCVLAGGEGGDFSPGAFVRAQIAVESVQAHVRVEKDAVQTMNGDTIVFIQDEHGVEPRDVQVGLSDGEYVQITSGLEPGETYVGHGSFGLKAELVTSGLDPHAGHGH